MLYPINLRMANLFRKIKKGKVYWYIGESKREGRKVRRIWQKYLGPADRVADQLVNGATPTEVDVLEFGLCATLLNLNYELEFVESVNKVILKREQGLSYGEHLLLTIINRIDDPKSHNKFGDWFDSTMLKRVFSFKKDYLSSQNFWNHWNKINEEQINNIQELLLEKLTKKYDISELCYDPTNFTTYIQEHKNQKIMQFGHSKDKRKGFRQVNLSLLVTKKEGIPLWHHTYNGNINDATEFKDLINTLVKRVSFFSKVCRKITLVFDKGNNSKRNIKKMSRRLGFFIVGSLKPSEFSELFNIPLEDFKGEYLTSTEKRVYFVSKTMNIYDSRKKVVVTYSNELAYKNRVRVDKALDKALNQLKNLQSRIKNAKLSRDELLIKVHEISDKSYIKGLINYEVEQHLNGLLLKFKENKEAYEKLSRRFGKNLLFTDDFSLKAEEVIKVYSSKSIVEEQIKNLKDKHVISFTPMWCWTDKMIRVHAFSCVMALLFLRCMVKKAKDSGIKLSQDKIITQLKKIRLSLLRTSNSNKVHTKLTRLNSSQRELKNIFRLQDYV